MSNRTIILQINRHDKTEQHSFECQVVIIGNDRNYVLDSTTQNLSDLAPGCKVFDDGVLFTASRRSGTHLIPGMHF